MQQGPLGSGPAEGLTLAVKDVIDVAGLVTGLGNPAWARAQKPATENAPVVDRLLHGGARYVGKTVTSELAFGLDGQNAHYGMPRNPAAPDRIPGGSSSGSAVAVAAGDADIGLGTDTGGSVRVPATLCGVYGLRCTHDRLPMQGIMALAPSFDALGWFARDADAMARTADSLFDRRGDPTHGFRRAIAASTYWAACAPAVRPSMEKAASLAIEVLGVDRDHIDPLPSPEISLSVYRPWQGFEIWQEWGPWVSQSGGDLGPEIRERLTWTASITMVEADNARVAAHLLRRRVLDALGDDGVIVLPGAPVAAPHRAGPDEAMAEFRRRMLAFSAPAALLGCPQLSIPIAVVDGEPVGLSLLAAPGRDRELITAAQVIEAALGNGAPKSIRRLNRN